MPALGMNQDTATLLSWLKEEGDAVLEGEPLMEVETDKAVMEIEAPASGRLVGVSVRAGEEVAVGSTIARIVAEGEEPTGAPPDEAPAPPEANPAGSPTAEPAAVAPTPHHEIAATSSARPLASPKARRLADERGHDLGALAGSGPGGAIIARDVPEERPPAGAAVRAPSEAPPTITAAPELRTPLAELTRLADATGLLETFARVHDRNDEIEVGDLLVKFAAAAAGTHRLLGEGGVDVTLERYRDGALATTPIRDADRLNLGSLARVRQRVEPDERVEATRALPLTLLLDAGVDGYRPRHGGPVSLTAGRLEARVIAVDGAPGVRQTLPLTLTFDPERVPPAAAVAFLSDFASLVRDPTDLLVLF